jgi:hypothetical protein
MVRLVVSHRRSLVVTFLYLTSCILMMNALLSDAQVILPMNVCYQEGATGAQVQEFCRSVPECGGPATTTITVDDNLLANCFMRCDDPQVVESNYICEDYGMICHHSKVCEVPPTMLFDETKDDDTTTATNEDGGDFTPDALNGQ